MIRNITLPDSLSFSDYFKLNFYPEEILNYFGYSFEMKLLTFVKSVCDLVEFDALEKRTRLAFATAWEIANREKRLVVDKDGK